MDNEHTKEIFYPYNETFPEYSEPRAGKRAKAFVDQKNREKGGIWVLHSKEQYDKWYLEKGQHLEYIKMSKLISKC